MGRFTFCPLTLMPNLMLCLMVEVHKVHLGTRGRSPLPHGGLSLLELSPLGLIPLRLTSLSG